MKDRTEKPEHKPADPNWKPAQTYPSSLKMVEDLEAHDYPNKVLLDGGEVVQFALLPPPPLLYYTQADWSVGQTPTSGQPTGGGSTTTTQGQEAGVLPFGGHVYTGVDPYPSMKGDSTYQLSLTVPSDWPRGSNQNTISVGEHGSSGGPQARHVTLSDKHGKIVWEVQSDTYPAIPYSVGEPGAHPGAILLPGETYSLDISNNGPLPAGGTYPPITDMVVYCYAPAK